MIVGVDEVGRGPWAGPLVVGAVMLGGATIEGLADSKKLTKRRRQALDELIRQQAAAWALGWVSAPELDQLGMAQALRVATRRAIRQIQAICRRKQLTCSEIIIDGSVNFLAETALSDYVTTMTKADSLVPSVSAASIIAKVARDAYMAEQDQRYPGYGFARHSGYGVAQHRAAIEQYGVTPLHRLSFAPLAKYTAPDGFVSTENTTQIDLRNTAPATEQVATTRQIGDKGEQATVDWLVADGHQIIARNWRTRHCEIDIVSIKDAVLYFTEVKYRKNDTFGGGLAAITTKKQQQIRFAAELFMAKHLQYGGRDMRLLAVAVEGDPPAVQEYVVLD